jgi:hypothetical protein
VNRALSGSSRRETLRGISGKCGEIHLKEEEEEESSNPCTGLANPHRITTTTEEVVYLSLFLPNL